MSFTQIWKSHLLFIFFQYWPLKFHFCPRTTLNFTWLSSLSLSLSSQSLTFDPSFDPTTFVSQPPPNHCRKIAPIYWSKVLDMSLVCGLAQFGGLSEPTRQNLSKFLKKIKKLKLFLNPIHPEWLTQSDGLIGWLDWGFKPSPPFLTS